MTDRPSAAELLAATRSFLDNELVPHLTDPRLRFHTRIASHVLGIVERELQFGEEHLLWEWEWLAELLELTVPAPERMKHLADSVRDGNRQLCQRIRKGEYDESARFLALAEQLRRTIERKLEIANPRFLAAYRASIEAESTADPRTEGGRS